MRRTKILKIDIFFTGMRTVLALPPNPGQMRAKGLRA